MSVRYTNDSVSIINDFKIIISKNCFNKIVEEKKHKLNVFKYNFSNLKIEKSCENFACYVAACVSQLSKKTVKSQDVLDCLYNIISCIIHNYICIISNDKINIWDYYPISIIKNYYEIENEYAMLALYIVKNFVNSSFNNEEFTQIFYPYDYFYNLSDKNIDAIKYFINSKKNKHIFLLSNVIYSIKEDPLLCTYIRNIKLWHKMSDSDKKITLKSTCEKIWFICLTNCMDKIHDDEDILSDIVFYVNSLIE